MCVWVEVEGLGEGRAHGEKGTAKGGLGMKNPQYAMYEIVLWEIRTQVRWVYICAVLYDNLESHAAT